MPALAANVVSIAARGMRRPPRALGQHVRVLALLAFLVVVGTLVFVEGVAKIKTLTGFR